MKLNTVKIPLITNITYKTFELLINQQNLLLEINLQIFQFWRNLTTDQTVSPDSTQNRSDNLALRAAVPRVQTQETHNFLSLETHSKPQKCHVFHALLGTM